MECNVATSAVGSARSNARVRIDDSELNL